MVGGAVRTAHRPAKRLVDEVPDATALEQGVFPEQIPVFFQTTHRITHRMGIFALDQRPVLRLGGIFLASPVTMVHGAEDVRVPVLFSPFVLDGAGGIELLEPGVGLLEIGACSGFVAEAPDDDRRMVDVPLDRTLGAFHVGLLIGGLLRQRLRAIAHAMGLDVAFGDHIQAVFVAKLIPTGVIRIVAGAHRIDIEALHNRDIADHIKL